MRKILPGLILLFTVNGGETTDYAKAHKYFGDDPKEFTYTITSVMQFAKPFDH